MIRKGCNPLKSLRLVARAEGFHYAQESQVAVGDVVRLNSGGPTMLICDLDGDTAIVGWYEDGAAIEMTIPLPAIHRVSPV